MCWASRAASSASVIVVEGRCNKRRVMRKCSQSEAAPQDRWGGIHVAHPPRLPSCKLQLEGQCRGEVGAGCLLAPTRLAQAKSRTLTLR